jgi:hypothetical protein
MGVAADGNTKANDGKGADGTFAGDAWTAPGTEDATTTGPDGRADGGPVEASRPEDATPSDEDAGSESVPDASDDASPDDATAENTGAIDADDAGSDDATAENTSAIDADDAGLDAVAADATTPPPPMSQAFVDVAIGAAATGSCSQVGWKLLLEGAEGPSSTVRTPSSTLTSTTCGVVLADAGLYAFQANTDHTPQPDGQGSVEIWAQVDASGYASNVSASFDLGRNVYTEGDCTIVPWFRVTVDPPPPSPSIAPGRIFGHLSCPNAVGVLPDLCSIGVDFVYENCAQH